jgi:hypothetical protein
MGQPFHLGPWFGRTLFRPVVEFAFLYVRWKYHLDMQQASPKDSVAVTAVPILLIHGQIDSKIPIRHSRQIHANAPPTVFWEVPNADHCGAISAAPQEFEHRLLAWFSRLPTSQVATAASAVPPGKSEAEPRRDGKTSRNPSPGFCISCASSVDNPPFYPVDYSSPHFLLNQTPRRARGLAEHLREHP